VTALQRTAVWFLAAASVSWIAGLVLLFSIPADEGFNLVASLMLFLAAALSLCAAVLIAASARRRPVRVVSMTSAALWVISIAVVMGREIGVVEAVIMPGLALVSLLLSGGMLIASERHGRRLDSSV
jgi:hypothetical protein